jgi:hypothetical protein
VASGDFDAVGAALEGVDGIRAQDILDAGQIVVVKVSEGKDDLDGPESRVERKMGGRGVVAAAGLRGPDRDDLVDCPERIARPLDEQSPVSAFVRPGAKDDDRERAVVRRCCSR